MQPWNKKYISSTELVLKFDKSKEVNEEQPLNIDFIYLTEDKLKLDKSKEVNFLHP